MPCSLQKHGLVTWGETGEESYEATIEFVSRAAQAIEEAADGRFGLGGHGRAAGGEGVDRSSSAPSLLSAARCSRTRTA